MCALGVTRHSHSTFSPSYTLPSSLESFPSPKICKMRNTGSVSMGSNHTHKGGVVHTEDKDVSYWAHCVAFYDFCERENSLEKELRCGKAKKGSGQV